LKKNKFYKEKEVRYKIVRINVSLQFL